MTGGHGHSHAPATATGRHRRRLILVVAITASVFVAQVIGGLVSGSLALLADAGHMLTDSTGLLEATPRGIDLDRIRRHILEVDGVTDVHDLHAWTITSGVPVLSAHVVVDAASLADGRSGEVLDRLGECLGEHFDVDHCTLPARTRRPPRRRRLTQQADQPICLLPAVDPATRALLYPRERSSTSAEHDRGAWTSWPLPARDAARLVAMGSMRSRLRRVLLVVVAGVAVMGAGLLGGCAPGRVGPPAPAVPGDSEGSATPAGTAGSGASAAPPRRGPQAPREPAVASPTPSPTPPSARTVTVVVNGDLLWHNTLWFGAQEDARRRGKDGYDFAPLLAGLKPVVAGADAAICHEEVPVAPAGGPYRNYPLFAAPPQVVTAIKATGYDLCTTASNHSLDGGFAGLRRTLDQLDRAGIKQAGTYRTRAESERPTIFRTASGVRVGLVAGTFGTNGLRPPAGKRWAVAPTDPTLLLRRAEATRRAGADVVLVALHAGTEYSSREDGQQRRLARRLTASPDVDLVYGHHAHVVQPWTVMNGKWVAYGLGNTVAQHDPSVVRGYEGVTGRFTFTRRADGRFTVSRAEYIPTLVSRYRPGRPARVVPISAALKDATGSYRTRLLRAQQRTSDVVTAHRPSGLIRR